jgi:hypothetical protein
MAGGQEQAGGQEKASPPPSTAPPQDGAKAKPAVVIEQVELTAKDGFPLKATWYQGDRGTAAAAILMLHDLGRDGRDFQNLAKYFADNGHGVLVPDLRGHGRSRNDAQGQAFQPRRYGPAEGLLLQADIEACKKFLVQKNDEEVCNIELMVIIAAGATSIPALGWCVLDWAYLPAVVKQGQDVKGIVMLSPPRTHQALPMPPLLQVPLVSGTGHPQPLEILLVGGEKSRQFRDLKSMYGNLSATRGRRDEPDDWRRHNLYLVKLPSDSTGVDLIERHADVVPDKIFDFIEERILSRAAEYGHQKRSGSPTPPPPPLDGG